jgi:serine/threonine protein kinase
MTAMLEYEVGERIDGRYRVERQLGVGGMGATYRAIDEKTGSPVVIKIPSIAIIGDPAMFTRYEREREIGERLEHPRIQNLIRAGQFPGGAPYLVLDYVEGVSMRTYLAEHAPLAVDEALRLGAQLADTLAYTHDHGVIHRDVKPENLLLTPKGDVVLLDFGIASLKGARRVTFHRLSNEVGTPDYMAPEQVSGERGDARTDVYAVGVLLYEMLTGAVPFQGDNALAVMGQRLTREAPSVRVRRPDVPPEVDGIVRKALRRERVERSQTMSELRDDLLHPDQAQLPAFADTGFAPVSVGPMPGARGTVLVIVLTLAALVAITVIAQLVHQAQIR